MTPTLHALCPACWTPLATGATACRVCGRSVHPPRRGVSVWIVAILGIALGSISTWWLARSRWTGAEESEPGGPLAPLAPPVAESPPAPAAPIGHVIGTHDATGARIGHVLLLQAHASGPVVGLLPLGRLPLRGPLRGRDGVPMAVAVLAVADAYGFVLLVGLAADAGSVSRPRRSAIHNGEHLLPLGTDQGVRVLGRSATSQNELVLDRELVDGTELLDSDGMAAALALGGNRALAVTPAWSWLDAPPAPQPLANVQAQLRARDPALLLEDVARAVSEAATPEATRAALERLEIGFAQARGPELVAAYDRALRNGHRLLARRLSEAGRATEGLTHAKACVLRFAGDVDWLADAIVMAASAGDFQAASEYWAELRSRDAALALERAEGLIDAWMRAADTRVRSAPREAAELLARAVDLFTDHAALRMSYAGALLASGDTDAARWQAQIAASRDPSLGPRWQAIAERTTTSGSAVEVPIDPASNIVQARCSVAGRSLELVVDTGASVTVLPMSFAGSGSPTGRRVRIQTASGEIEAELMRLPELKIGSITVRHITAATVDLPGSLAGKGLLGMNVLRRLNMELDAGRGVLTLRK